MTVSISILLHLLAAIVWLGGLVFALFALRPAVIAVLPPPQRALLTSWVLRRFFWLVTGAVVVLLATGIHLIIAEGGFAQARPGVLVMLAGGLLMMALFAFVATPYDWKLRALVVQEQWPAAGAQLEKSRKLVWFNLVLGILITGAVKLT
jgi:uncharacterized membrane protein